MEQEWPMFKITFKDFKEQEARLGPEVQYIEYLENEITYQGLLLNEPVILVASLTDLKEPS
jgi:predicted metal-dependent hydrolase